ncbi:MAG TPA: hypothetical protein VN455_03245 [Methanotrichaceae archaeon]|nr:hypothetical protein [Methanotrichaceae archaeon]
MRKDAEVIDRVEKLFPGAMVRRSRKIYNKNSQIHVLDVTGHEGRAGEKVAAKLFYNYQPQQVASEFMNLGHFYVSCRSDSISAPEPLYVHPEGGLMVMRYIEGTNLGWMLHGIRPADGQRLAEVMDLSAAALARFHRLFKMPGYGPMIIDSISKERDINACIECCRERAGSCSLDFRIRPFFDFSAWNIMVGPEARPRIYLIDFPKSDYLSTPHLDLGRFKFSLELIKQYPPSKIIGLNWWDASVLYDRFLSRYCQEMAVELSQEDHRLIECFKAANIRRSQDISRKSKFNWRSKLERFYLKTFSKAWLESAKSGSH